MRAEVFTPVRWMARTCLLGAACLWLLLSPGAGNTASAQQEVRVVYTTKPSLTLPANLTVNATSMAGAVVTYAASAIDIVNGSLAVICSMPSGGTFPIGTSLVTCAAIDAANNRASGSFTVRVQAGPVYITFLGKLEKILDEMDAAHGHNVNVLCGQIGGFIHEVAQAGKKLTVSEATTLTTEARRIEALIGCRD